MIICERNNIFSVVKSIKFLLKCVFTILTFREIFKSQIIILLKAISNTLSKNFHNVE